MRFALISDIHGNILALDAVLADCRKAGVERFWFLGDYVAIGPEPAAVLDRLVRIEGAEFVRGNTDRYSVTGDGPPPDLAAVHADPRLAAVHSALAASFGWTRGYLVATGWFDWVAALPLELRLEGPDGTRLLAVHAAPGTDDGEGIHPGRSNADLAAMVAGADADVVLVGHTHEAMARRVGSIWIVNLGSVSNPRAPDLRASYLLLDVDEDGPRCQHRRVEYDQADFAARVARSRHPAADFIMSHQRREQRSRPVHADHLPLGPGHWIELSRPRQSP